MDFLITAVIFSLISNVFNASVLAESHKNLAPTSLREVFKTSGGNRYLYMRIPTEKGIPEGKIVAYHQSGQVFVEQQYHQGIKEGNGSLRWEGYKDKIEEPINFTYKGGYLHGPVTQKGKLLKEFENGYPKNWKEIYKSPFSKLLPDQKVISPPTISLVCGEDSYSDQTGDYNASLMKLNQVARKTRVNYCFSEGGGCFKGGLDFTAETSLSPSEDGFYAFSRDGNDGELRLRIILKKGKYTVQAFGYIRERPHPLKVSDMEGNDDTLADLIRIRYDYDTSLQTGLEKMELQCKVKDSKAHSH